MQLNWGEAWHKKLTQKFVPEGSPSAAHVVQLMQLALCSIIRWQGFLVHRRQRFVQIYIHPMICFKLIYLFIFTTSASQSAESHEFVHLHQKEECHHAKIGTADVMGHKDVLKVRANGYWTNRFRHFHPLRPVREMLDSTRQGFLSWRLQEDDEEEVSAVLIWCGFSPLALACQLFCYETSLLIVSRADD